MRQVLPLKGGLLQLLYFRKAVPACGSTAILCSWLIGQGCCASSVLDAANEGGGCSGFSTSANQCLRVEHCKYVPIWLIGQGSCANKHILVWSTFRVRRAECWLGQRDTHARHAGLLIQPCEQHVHEASLQLPARGHPGILSVSLHTPVGHLCLSECELRYACFTHSCLPCHTGSQARVQHCDACP